MDRQNGLDAMTDLSLAGKTALITGASRTIGIGAAIARAFARAGADLFLTYYRPYDASMAWGSQPAEAETLLVELRELGVRVVGLEADLSDPHTPARLMDAALEHFERVDILVNNATYDVETDIFSLTPELLDRHYAVNVRGATLLCAEFLKRLPDGVPGELAHGSILNLTSGQSLGPMADNLPYAVTKGAVEALTTSLFPSAALKGVTVNAIDPGATDTGWIPPALYADFKERSPFKRVGQPQDAANLAVFLASPAGAWITGQVIHSRGGW
jgi:3-oxoacyl-[acyl-carrier protein] reductase